MLSREERRELLTKLEEYRNAVERYGPSLATNPVGRQKVMDAYANLRTLIEHDIS